MQATRTLPIEHVSLLEEAPERTLAFMKTEHGANRFRHNHEMDIIDNFTAVRAIDLADIALHTVSHHGAAHFS
jgi:hypothetical protein